MTKSFNLWFLGRPCKVTFQVYSHDPQGIESWIDVRDVKDCETGQFYTHLIDNNLEACLHEAAADYWYQQAMFITIACPLTVLPFSELI